MAGYLDLHLKIHPDSHNYKYHKVLPHDAIIEYFRIFSDIDSLH